MILLAALRIHTGSSLLHESWCVHSVVKNPLLNNGVRSQSQRLRSAYHCHSQPVTPTRWDFFWFLRMGDLEGNLGIYEPGLRSVRLPPPRAVSFCLMLLTDCSPLESVKKQDQKASCILGVLTTTQLSRTLSWSAPGLS